MTQDESTLIHREYVSGRPFEAVIEAFEAVVGTLDDASLQEAVTASSDEAGFEARLRAFEGSSGFMKFFVADHGAWLARVGQKARARMYVIGNPLIARTMLRHDVAMGLHVPVRVLIYEHRGDGKCHLGYDVPSSLMARLGNEELLVAARKLDDKLARLAEQVTGDSARG
ncbi:hypothetical protein CYFUS_001227 [Cystobacter fuscus]|uniref:DUF302 domain-containing protein n=1 Tax=Cystobacter fuscus TaxID=43 RepID=A0A250IX02_9BACT|nr:DUF302 domain-containing protein [Cystobacter fuscus]ATB35813.1 hypothetical protein CYFUS_001227 [Cystobacter fuscus]